MRCAGQRPEVGRRKALAQRGGVRESPIKYYSELGLLPYRQAGEGLARRYEQALAV